VISGLLERRDSSQQKQITQILDYASARRGRHKLLAAHLGEQIANCDTGCDQCAPPVRSAVQAIEETRELPDNPGQVIIECLMSFPFNVGRPSLVKALTGSAASNVNPDRVRHFGSMPGIVKSSLDAAIDGLIDQGYIVPFESEEGYKLLRVTAKAQGGVPKKAVSIKPKPERKPRAARAERRWQEPRTEVAWSPSGAQPRSYTRLEPPKVENEVPPTPEEADLFERLRAWRRVTANKLGVAPFVIFHDTTLWAIARARPQTAAELLSVRGFGQSHLAKYGPDLFNLINGE
jgi:ATP-dependent DNA helicase RecQ